MVTSTLYSSQVEPKKQNNHTLAILCKSRHRKVIINRAKADYYTGIISNKTDDPNALWRVLNGILQRKKSETRITDGSPDMSIAHIFCKFFRNNSCILDPWPTTRLKECIDIMATYITKLVNMSLSEGAVPNQFKKTIVATLINKMIPRDTDLSLVYPLFPRWLNWSLPHKQSLEHQSVY